MGDGSELDGRDDGANTGGSYSGVKGMYKAGEDLNKVGDALSYAPTPVTQFLGKVLQAGGDGLSTIADFNTLNSNEASKNLLIRVATFAVGEKIAGTINKSTLNETQKYAADQLTRKLIDEVKDQTTTKPSN